MVIQGVPEHASTGFDGCFLASVGKLATSYDTSFEGLDIPLQHRRP